MTVIKLAGYVQPVPGVQSALTGENDAVRRFALRIAEKIFRDPELNQTAPLLVDKVVMMLISASRSENPASDQTGSCVCRGGTHQPACQSGKNSAFSPERSRF